MNEPENLPDMPPGKYLNSAFQLHRTPMVILRPEGKSFRVVDANNAYYEVNHLKRSDVLEKEFPARSLNPPDAEKAARLAKLRHTLAQASANVERQELLLHRKDILGNGNSEDEQYWETEIIPLGDEAEKPSHILCIMTDVSERICIERKYQNELLKYKSIFDNSMSALFLTRPDGRILEANKAACDLFGYTPDELRRFGRQQILDHSEPIIHEKIKERKDKGRASGELTGITKNGIRFPIEFSSALFKDENGDDISSTVITDISERKKNEQEIALLINNTEEAFILLDQNLLIRSFNKQFFRLYETFFNREIKVGDPILSYAQAERKKLVENIYTQVLAGHVVESDLNVAAPDGSEKVFRLKYSPAKNEEGEVIGAFIAIRDITETKQIERDLTESRNTLQKILDQSLDIICTMNEEGVFLNVSAASHKILGYEPAELIGRPYIDLLCPDDLLLTQKVAEAVMNGGEITNFENRYRHKNGSLVSIVWSARWDSHERIMYAIARDASEKRMAEDQLKSSERRFKSLVQDGSDLIAILDPEGNYVYVSPTSLSVLEIDPNEFIGKNAFTFIHEEDREQVMADFARLATEKRINITPFRFRHNNGEWRWIETTVTNLLEDPDVKGIVANSRDVTDRISVEEAIKIQHNNYRDLFNNAPAFICILKGPDHIFQMANPDYEFLTGKKNLIGQRAIDVFPELVEQGYFDLLDNVYKTGEPFSRNELPAVINRNGKQTRLYVNFTYQAYRNIKNEIEGIFVFGNDVTYQVEARKALYESNERYKYVTKATSDAIWDWDLLTGTFYWGEGFELLFGYNPNELPADLSSWTKHIHTEDIHHVINSVNETVEGNKTNWSDEYRYLKADGTYAYVMDRGFVIRDAQGRGVRMVGAMQDITNQKNEEAHKTLLTDISLLFSKSSILPETLEKVLERIIHFDNSSLAEIWLVSPDKQRIDMVSRIRSHGKLDQFYEETPGIQSFLPGEGMAGTVWKSRTIEFWESPGTDNRFIRADAANKIGLTAVTGIPLIYSNDVIGVLILGYFNQYGKNISFNAVLFPGFAEHLAAEIRRRQLEQELTQIFNAAPDIICIVGRDGSFKKVNPAACDILEYSVSELLALSLGDLVHPDDRHFALSGVPKLLEGQPTYHCENRLITKSGKVKWLAWSYSLSRETGLLYALAKDVTEKKELTYLVERSSQMARIGSWELVLTNDNSDVMFWSPMTREILEAPADYQPSMTGGLELYQGESHEHIKSAVSKLIEAGEDFDLELLLTTAKGNARWVRCIGQSERVNGKCVKIFGSFQDIHQRKMAEISLIETNKKLLSTLESIQDGFYSLDKEWTVTYWNREAEKLLMTRREDVIGKNLWEKFPDAINLKFYQEYHRAMQQNIPVRFEEFFPPTESWYDINAFPSESGLTIYFTDITGRKKAEEKLNTLNNELVRQTKELALSNAELEQFAYVASHDLQEPLRMISSFLTQLEKHYKPQLDERAQKYIYFAVDGAQRMRQIILDLLEFSRVGRIVGDLEKVDLNALVSDILTLHQSQFEENHFEVSTSNLPTVFGLKAPLRQVFQNLISNAIKYRHPDRRPSLKIESEDYPGFWQFTISDNGIGINAEYFDRIFVIFQRLHSRNDYPGIGMGLAICKKIVENMGGEIWVNSQEGVGSAFCFKLPKDAA